MSIFRGWIIILCLSCLLFSKPVLASETVAVSIECGENTIGGSLEFTDASGIKLSAEIVDMQSNTVITEIEAIVENNVYTISIDPTAYEIKEYTVKVIATKGNQSAHTDTQLMLGTKQCNTIAELKEKIETYAAEAKEFFENHQDIQSIPGVFLKTGLTEFLAGVVEKTGKTFAGENGLTHHDIPSWSFSPEADRVTTFESQYQLLPPEYKNQYAYFRFKGLLIPVQKTNNYMDENTLLGMLNNGGILAPETNSLDELSVVKMLYNHAVSTTKSPFAGVGSHLSVFSEVGDELKVYVKMPHTSSYEERTYTLKFKREVDPAETDTIKTYKKDGADIVALISCKYGNILGSTEGREILFFSRIPEEIGSFQKSIISITEDPEIAKYRANIDSYFDKKDLSDEDVHRLVTKLEDMEKNGNNQLQMIATYGKYMAAYDAIYD